MPRFARDIKAPNQAKTNFKSRFKNKQSADCLNHNTPYLHKNQIDPAVIKPYFNALVSKDCLKSTL